MVVARLRFVTGRLNVIDSECGGIAGPLRGPEEWDWRDVRESILHMLEGVAESLTQLKEIEAHSPPNTGR